MTQRNLQWGNNVIVGHGSVSAGVDWQQQRLTRRYGDVGYLQT
jgi:vitamin B12 transporter